MITLHAVIVDKYVQPALFNCPEQSFITVRYFHKGQYHHAEIPIEREKWVQLDRTDPIDIKLSEVGVQYAA